ncbi:MAG: hypothetical protein QW423_01210 [Candidatus Aenigmatarchaeota archaeon]
MKFKGITTNTIFLLVFIALVTTTSLLIFWKWVEMGPGSISERSCKTKQYNFCMDWRIKNYKTEDKPNWSQIPPKGNDCAKFGVYEPSKYECDEILR